MDILLDTAEKAVLATAGVSKLTGKKITASKDKNQNVILDIYVLVKYGCRIPEVAWNLQENVKAEIVQKIAVGISKINIHIQGINFDEETENAQI